MKKNNIRLISVSNGNESGFDIYLDFSGQREYLMSHRHHGVLFNILKDGIGLATLQREYPRRCGLHHKGYASRMRSKRCEKAVSHLLLVVDDYLSEREAFLAA